MTPNELINAAAEALKAYREYHKEPGWLGFEHRDLVIYSYGLETPQFRRVIKLSREDIELGPTARSWFNIGSKLFEYFKEHML